MPVAFMCPPGLCQEGGRQRPATALYPCRLWSEKGEGQGGLSCSVSKAPKALRPLSAKSAVFRPGYSRERPQLTFWP